MSFKAGNKFGGRTKGSTNKINQPIRDKFLQLLEDNIEQVQDDLNELEPKDRLKILLDLAGFCVPRLKAMEVTELTTKEPPAVEVTEEDIREIRRVFDENY